MAEIRSSIQLSDKVVGSHIELCSASSNFLIAHIYLLEKKNMHGRFFSKTLLVVFLADTILGHVCYTFQMIKINMNEESFHGENY